MRPLIYFTPETEVTEVRFETNLMQSPFNGDNNQKPVDSGEEGF